MHCAVTAEPKPGYRPCVGLMLLDAQHRVFVGQRCDTRGEAWQMPQGGIDPGEDVISAGLRELKEEIGTDAATLIEASRWWRSYELPPEIAARLWHGRYRGQTQKWLAFRFTGTDADIKIDGPHPEFCAWRWFRADELVHRIVPFKRDVYLSVVEEFRHLWA
jgi:putative (di)nucleoside polyphosphate hydrolase